MAQTNWTVKGRLQARTQFPELAAKFGDTVPLEGVRVKVSAKEFGLDPTGWNEWGEDVTDANGNFEIRNEKDKSKRLFRVRVMFKDDTLKIYPDNNGVLSKLFDCTTDLIPGGPVQKVVNDLKEDLLEAALGAVSRLTFDVDWITVHEDHGADQKKSPGVVDLGDLVFQQGGAEELGGPIQRRHADLWFLARKMMGWLADFGPGLGFIEKKPIAIKYPHKSSFIGDGVEASYSDPFNDTTFLIQNTQTDDFDLQTAMHELMHLWAYQHSSGETGLAWQLIIHGSTHNGRQSKTWTAFHEAFAEFAKNELYRQHFGKGATIYGGIAAERRPYTRSELKSLGVSNLSEVDNFEDGWMSVFNLLVCGKVCELDMNGTDTFASPTLTASPLCRQAQLSFADILRVFQPQGTGEYHTEISLSQMTLLDFLNRLSASMPEEFSSDRRDAYLAILNPAETAQPKDLLGPKAEPAPSDPGRLGNVGARLSKVS
jgi:hypothetical protein